MTAEELTTRNNAAYYRAKSALAGARTTLLESGNSAKQDIIQNAKKAMDAARQAMTIIAEIGNCHNLQEVWWKTLDAEDRVREAENYQELADNKWFARRA